jgi:Raf kinase inhibitor-like YbhB/YbcL family protein
VAGAFLLLAACDTGDGKTLPAPTGTLPPPTVPTTTVPPPVDGGLLPSELATAAPDVDPAAFQLIAPWPNGGTIDPRHTCDGDDISPALSWMAPPDGASELAISMVDESTADGEPFVHWVIAGLDPTMTSLAEGEVPLGAIQALNFLGEVGWSGPCPPVGEGAHIYRFTIYALNQQVELADGTSASDLLDFVKVVSVATADVTGTFQR